VHMKLKKPQDLFLLSAGDVVTKRNLFDLIQYSKVIGSQYWGGVKNYKSRTHLSRESTGLANHRRAMQ